MIVVVAEKPSVARDLARVLGASARGDGCLRGNGYAVTWAIGHLVALAEPEQIDARWKSWRLDSLPMIPQRWPLCVIERTRDQFRVIERLLTDRETKQVICATDAGREGELIFRYIAEEVKLDKPVKRLWVSSLTEEAISRALAQLKDASEYDCLADAARGRSRADWLVGMNLTRAYTLSARRDSSLTRGPARFDRPTSDSRASTRDVYSVGRVQTPTLAMIVERDRAIRNFVPEDYLEVALDLLRDAGDAADSNASFEARYVRVESPNEPARLDKDRVEAEALCARARSGQASVADVEREEKRARPALLYDLTELQRHASRLYGFSAQRTLELAQALYESHKLISYPRTDSRHLSTDVAQGLGAIVEKVRAPYDALLPPDVGQRPLGKRFVDESQVTDHHAIIPTGRASQLREGSDEGKLYDLIVRRLLAAYLPDHVWAITRVRVVVRNETPDGVLEDPYLASGDTILEEGYRALDVKTRREPAAVAPSLPVLARGQRLLVEDARIDAKRTRPPAPLNEASLLTAMETAGRELDDKELSVAMRERGLGTPATRAAIIETLVSRGYVVREGKALKATAKGEELIDVVHPQVRSAALTGEWEHKLRLVERRRYELATFMREIEDFVRGIVGGTGNSHAPGPVNGHAHAPANGYAHERTRTNGPGQGPTGGALLAPANGRGRAIAHEPPNEQGQGRESYYKYGRDLDAVLRERFGFPAFRRHQREVCEQIVAGRNVLLVMPTGAGKSLCYQLPGVARGGTTLVVSPLIALMDDQARKLTAQGFVALRIHSGIAREDARNACRRYLRGEVDFLFIAPERLRVPGFPELLAKRPPVLVAIDEAHCISQWGHDFRPDYRMLRDRLPRLAGAPIVALTATATKAVQRDILEQLDIRDAVLSIHGFRRDNLAIEVLDTPPSRRAGLARRVLEEAGRTPAIIYAPTRKHAEQLAADLATGWAAAAYHAGMDAASRERVQSQFLAGQLDVIVATIAFGMGVDKPDVRSVLHLASPGSVEAYYQEIGRAGRDGRASLALLFCSGADRRTQQFFLERDYPELSELERVYAALGQGPVFKGSLARKLGLEDEDLDRRLDKLWVHGAVSVSADDEVTARGAGFRATYPAQRRAKEAQLTAMGRYIYAERCRMVTLVRHFGDDEDRGEPCGKCDLCLGQAPHAWLVETRGAARERNSARVEPAKPRPRSRAERGPRESHVLENVPASGALVEALRAFRREEARSRSIPAFRIFTDRVLGEVAVAQPTSESALLALTGVGPSLVRRYGEQLLEIVRSHM